MGSGKSINSKSHRDNGSDSILWSWHIWFVDQYDVEASAQKYPNGKVFMDRNLGALSNERNNPKSNGLLYQWGRKDPFAGKAVDDGTTSINTTSDLIYCAKFIPSDECKTDVDYSIANPTTFIGNWNESMDGDLWSGSLAINNPCPKGWTIPKSYKILIVTKMTEI